MDILKELNELVAEYRGDGTVLTEGARFEELGFDSLDAVELIMSAEDKFGITFPDDVRFDTVDELVELIKSLKA